MCQLEAHRLEEIKDTSVNPIARYLHFGAPRWEEHHLVLLYFMGRVCRRWCLLTNPISDSRKEQPKWVAASCNHTDYNSKISRPVRSRLKIGIGSKGDRCDNCVYLSL